MNTRQCTVLIVDDSEIVRGMVRFALEEAGFVVAEAPSGKVALARLGEDPPVRCVVTDLQMPGMDGLDLIRAMRESPPHRHLPVVVLSGVDDLQRREEAFRRGACGFLTKPCVGQELVRAVRVMTA